MENFNISIKKSKPLKRVMSPKNVDIIFDELN